LRVHSSYCDQFFPQSLSLLRVPVPARRRSACGPGSLPAARGPCLTRVLVAAPWCLGAAAGAQPRGGLSGPGPRGNPSRWHPQGKAEGEWGTGRHLPLKCDAPWSRYSRVPHFRLGPGLTCRGWAVVKLGVVATDPLGENKRLWCGFHWRLTLTEASSECFRQSMDFSARSSGGPV
jgi:hypothetical protein